jgi:hypothetical protein
VTVDRNAAVEAAEALRSVLQLRLTASGWTVAETAMDALDRALTADDERVIWESAFDLDHLSERVQERLGRGSETAAPDRIRDRAGELIDRLAPDTSGDLKPMPERKQ